jgi:hypothetical protein
MPQKMQRSQIFLGEPRPPLAVTSRPQISGQAAGQPLATIVDLDQLLVAVMAALHADHPYLGNVTNWEGRLRPAPLCLTLPTIHNQTPCSYLPDAAGLLCADMVLAHQRIAVAGGNKRSCGVAAHNSQGEAEATVARTS